jgi:hypothetical protein
MESAVSRPVPFPCQDAFHVVAGVIKGKRKPSLPTGPITVGAFGRTPQWTDLGWRRSLVSAIGEQDLRIDGLEPNWQGIAVDGRSRDVGWWPWAVMAHRWRPKGRSGSGECIPGAMVPILPNSHRHPVGIPHVVVNGELVIDCDRNAGALPGKVV